MSRLLPSRVGRRQLLTFSPPETVEVNLYGGNRSAINEQKTLQDNSFAHRSSLLTFQMYASSSTYGNPYPEFGVGFVQG